mmetsp:Transcript_27404/g.68792  ORF Transcript_27404/g.68792 Transcript_27404/m.68792 type:complete len:546 (-) Transcript_27404:46-1683(-)
MDHDSADSEDAPPFCSPPPVHGGGHDGGMFSHLKNNFNTFTLFLIIVICLSLFFERFTHWVKTRLEKEKKPHLIAAVHNVYQEFMALGFISFTMYVLQNIGVTGFLSSLVGEEFDHHLFEFVHILTFVILVTYVSEALLVYWLARAHFIAVWGHVESRAKNISHGPVSSSPVWHLGALFADSIHNAHGFANLRLLFMFYHFPTYFRRASGRSSPCEGDADGPPPRRDALQSGTSAGPYSQEDRTISPRSHTQATTSRASPADSSVATKKWKATVESVVSQSSPAPQATPQAARPWDLQEAFSFCEYLSFILDSRILPELLDIPTQAWWITLGMVIADWFLVRIVVHYVDENVIAVCAGWALLLLIFLTYKHAAGLLAQVYAALQQHQDSRHSSIQYGDRKALLAAAMDSLDGGRAIVTILLMLRVLLLLQVGYVYSLIIMANVHNLDDVFDHVIKDEVVSTTSAAVTVAVPVLMSVLFLIPAILAVLPPLLACLLTMEKHAKGRQRATSQIHSHSHSQSSSHSHALSDVAMLVQTLHTTYKQRSE